MDLRKMRALTWVQLFGFLIFFPGSTLNAPESSTVTTAATATPTTLKRMLATETLITTTIMPRITSSKVTAAAATHVTLDAATITATTLLEDKKVQRTHSIRMGGATLPTATPVLPITTISRTASSTMSRMTAISGLKKMKEQNGIKGSSIAQDLARHQLQAEFTHSPDVGTTATTVMTTKSAFTAAEDAATVIKATFATIPAEVSLTGSSLNAEARNVTATMPTTTASFNSTAIRVGSSRNSSIGYTDGSVSTEQRTITTVALQPATTTINTNEQITTIESLAAAAVAQLVATLMPLTANNNEQAHDDNTNSNFAYNNSSSSNTNNNNNNNRSNNNNITYNKGIYYSNNAKSLMDMSAVGSNHHSTRPLQRPKVYHSNNDYQSNFNHNGQLYTREKQHELQQQPFDTLQQGQRYVVTTPTLFALDAAVAFDGNSITADNSSKMDPGKKQAQQTQPMMMVNIYGENELVTTPELPTTTKTTNTPESEATTTKAPIKTTTRRPRATTTPKPTPVVDDYLTVISQAGTHAYLPCNVKQLVKKPISWLRVRDGHILTVDQTTFIADQRFQSIYASNPERWSLQIKYVQLKDAGTYECQVSTEPKSSAIVTLRIVEPRTELIGEPTRHVKAGSQVKLRCIISQALEPPVFINWFYNQKQIYLHNRKGWRTEIERIELPAEPPTTTSTTPPTTTTTTAGSTASTTTSAAAAAGADGTVETSTENAPAMTAPSMSAAADDGVVVLYDNTTVVPPLPLVATGDATIMSTTLPTITRAAHSTNSATTIAGTTTPEATTTVDATSISTTTTTLWRTTTTIMLPVAEVKQITTASLIISSVEKQDSGNYTCSPSNSPPKTVVLHVLNGEYSASAITSGVSGNVIIGNCSGKWHCHLLHWHLGNILGILTLLWLIEFVLAECAWRKCQRHNCNISASTTSNIATANTTLTNCRTNKLIGISSTEPASTRHWNNFTNPTTARQGSSSSISDFWHRKWHRNVPHIQMLQFVNVERNKCMNNQKHHSRSTNGAPKKPTCSYGIGQKSSSDHVVASAPITPASGNCTTVNGNANIQLGAISTCTLAAKGKT